MSSSYKTTKSQHANIANGNTQGTRTARQHSNPHAHSSLAVITDQFGDISLNNSKNRNMSTTTTAATGTASSHPNTNNFKPSHQPKNNHGRSGSSLNHFELESNNNNNHNLNSSNKLMPSSNSRNISAFKIPPKGTGRTNSLQIEDDKSNTHFYQHHGSATNLPLPNNNNNSSSSKNNNTTHFQSSSSILSNTSPKQTSLSPTNGTNERVTTYTFDVPNGNKCTIVYNPEKIVGSGSFGIVYFAKILETGETVAVKKVLQDKRFKNRELQIMKLVKHRNVVEMKYCFYSTGTKDASSTAPGEELYLNLVLEFIPDTVFRFCNQYNNNNSFVPMIYVKLFIFQLCRSLNYIHSMNICHRDIKPQNLLIDPVNGVLKLCDFGSAKQLVKGEPNVSYICSRYYRAPELILGATNYTPAIDVWSMGCVMGELLIGQPLFPGESSLDQLVEIMKVLGTPSREEVVAMNKTYTEFKFPTRKPHPWSKVFGERKLPPETSDLITKFLQYDPRKRIKPLDALAHPFFDELRDPRTKLPNGRPLPVLFDFTAEELKSLSNPELKLKIISPHHRKVFN